jgi:hypothetical protein
VTLGMPPFVFRESSLYSRLSPRRHGWGTRASTTYSEQKGAYWLCLVAVLSAGVLALVTNL